MSMQSAKWIEDISPSLTLAITAKAEALKKEGKKVYAFTAGQPDFTTPLAIREKAKKAVDIDQFTKYSPEAGYLSLREAIAKKFNALHGSDYNASNILVSNGAKQVLAQILQVLLDPKDKAIIPCPAWLSYMEMVTMARGQSVTIDVASTQMKITGQVLSSLIQKHAPKVLILCSPSNPTGAVYSETELYNLVKIAAENKVMVILDVVYQRLTFGIEPVSLKRIIADFKDLVLIVDAVSKEYAMTGWRIGWVLGPQAFIKSLSAFQSHFSSGPCSISQAAAEEAMQGSAEKEVEEMVAAYAGRLELISSLADQNPQISYFSPQGAFYLWMDISKVLGKKHPLNKKVINGSIDFAEQLLEIKQVAVIPGLPFEAESALDCHIRLSFACSEANITEGMQRLKSFCQELA